MISDIRTASERDIPDLCAIWQSCFPDSEDYIRFFYRENFSRISVLVFTLNGKPVSAIHLMDALFADGSADRPVRFIYAAGTLPAYRSNGFMGDLIRFAVRRAEENGYGLFVKPASQLTDYYASFGFSPDSRFRIYRTEPEQNGRTGLLFEPLSGEEYNRMRNRFFAGRPFVKWPDVHVQWCVDENAFLGGQTVSFVLDGETHFLMGCPEEDVLRVIETDLTHTQLNKAAFALCERFGTGRIKAFLPEDSLGEGETVLSSAVFNAPLRHTYSNLLLF